MSICKTLLQGLAGFDKYCSFYCYQQPCFLYFFVIVLFKQLPYESDLQTYKEKTAIMCATIFSRVDRKMILALQQNFAENKLKY